MAWSKNDPNLTNDPRYLEPRITDLTTQLADTSRQTSVLSQGVSAVPSSANTPVTVEIEGRTLINLFGRLGRTALAATIAVESAKYYVFLKINQTSGVVAFVKYTGQTSLSLTWVSGEYAALYEVELSNYTKIGLEWDSVSVGLQYPYVDDVKHLQGVGIIAEGENLLPPFTEWTLHANAKVISPYELEAAMTGVAAISSVVLSAIEGQQYTISSKALTANSRIRIGSGDTSTYVTQLVSGSVVFINPIGSKRIIVQMESLASGTFTLSQPMLTLGSTAKPFVPRNPSSVIADVKLGAIGDKKDVLYEQDGRWLLRENTVKDENLTLSSSVSMLSISALATTAIITDKATGEVYKRVATLSGTGKEFTQGGANYRTISFNATSQPTTPVACYVRALAITSDVTDKIEGSLKVNGLTQVSADSGYRRTVVDGKSTWTKGSKFDYTANPVAVKLTYANNIRSAVNDAVAKVQDNSAMLSVHDKMLIDLYVWKKSMGG